MPGYGFDEINRVEVHSQTDEIFVLITGTAVLIAAEVRTDEVSFQTVRMKPGVVYNLPKGVWHNIAMADDAELIIVEKDHTHLNDCLHRPLTSAQEEELRTQIKHVLTH